MVKYEFEEVWEMLRQLDGQPPFTTLSDAHARLNRIVGSTSNQLIRQTERLDGRGWKDAKPVPRAAFENLWNRLSEEKTVQLSDVKGYKYVLAACLVSLPGLGVEKIRDRPLTIKLGPALEAEPADEFEKPNPKEFEDRGRIVVDPAICSGKPTIRGTRIMVTNILSMMAGGYSIDRILDSYPELSSEDAIAALEYAIEVIEQEKVIAFD